MINSILYKSLTIPLIVMAIIFTGALSAGAQDLVDNNNILGLDDNTGCKLRRNVSKDDVKSLVGVDLTFKSTDKQFLEQNKDLRSQSLATGNLVLVDSVPAGGDNLHDDLVTHWQALCTYTQFQFILNLVFFISGIITLFFLILSGILYVRSQGDQGGREKAKNTLVFAIVGFVVVLVSQIILPIVRSFIV